MQWIMGKRTIGVLLGFSRGDSFWSVLELVEELGLVGEAFKDEEEKFKHLAAILVFDTTLSTMQCAPYSMQIYRGSRELYNFPPLEPLE